jgi:hypothetical protein
MKYRNNMSGPRAHVSRRFPIGGGRHAGLVALLVLLLACLVPGGRITAAQQDYLNVLQAVARDIAGLRGEFPQLKEFSPAVNVNPKGIAGPAIDYGYHTHRAKQAGGWTSGVPNPNDDGVWFWIDVHDADTRAQIDTQPMTGAALCLDDKRVQFLILEGKKTKSVGGRIWAILKDHGVAPCDPSPGASRKGRQASPPK